MKKLVLRPRYVKPVGFVLCLLPALRLSWSGLRGELGPDAIEMVTHETGDWTMILLMLTLAITPLRKIRGFHGLIVFRRMLGLFGFFYAFLHCVTYVWFDKHFNVPKMMADIEKRPFLIPACLGFSLLVPLAITSTKGWIRRLGKEWVRLHRLVYLAVAAGVIHYLWLTKPHEAKPYFWAFVFALLMLFRFGSWWRKRRAQAVRVPETSLVS